MGRCVSLVCFRSLLGVGSNAKLDRRECIGAKPTIFTPRVSGRILVLALRPPPLRSLTLGRRRLCVDRELVFEMKKWPNHFPLPARCAAD
jgi:hypothetical protein